MDVATQLFNMPKVSVYEARLAYAALLIVFSMLLKFMLIFGCFTNFWKKSCQFQWLDE